MINVCIECSWIMQITRMMFSILVNLLEKLAKEKLEDFLAYKGEDKIL